MKTLKEKKGETIRRILDAAMEVFAEAGFAGARVDEIALRAGVNKAMIYYHIGDKAVLYGRVLHDIFGDTAERITRNIHKAGSPEEKLKTYVKGIVGTVIRHPFAPRIMMREVASGAENFPEIVVDDLGAIIKALAGILSAGEKAGVFAGSNPFVIHMMILGGAAFYQNMESLRKNHPAFPEGLKTLDKRIPAGIAGEIEKLILKAVRK
jgi:AcrR family transcriptional regulator